jgi:hypothetical protein
MLDSRVRRFARPFSHGDPRPMKRWLPFLRLIPILLLASELTRATVGSSAGGGVVAQLIPPAVWFSLASGLGVSSVDAVKALEYGVYFFVFALVATFVVLVAELAFLRHRRR